MIRNEVSKNGESQTSIKSDLSVSEVLKYFGNSIQPAIKPKAGEIYLKVLSISQRVLCLLQRSVCMRTKLYFKITVKCLLINKFMNGKNLSMINKNQH